MSHLRLVEASSTEPPAAERRPRRERPALRLVPGTGAEWRAKPGPPPPARKHNWLTLSVAGAAIAAAALISTSFSGRPHGTFPRSEAILLDVVAGDGLSSPRTGDGEENRRRAFPAVAS